MMIKFKEGYYYKYIGNEYNIKLLLNNKWYKCINTYKNIKSYYAKFEKDKWIASRCSKDFIESKYNPYVKKLLEENK